MSLFKKKYLHICSIIRIIGSRILRIIELANLRAEWSIKNVNNKTYPVNIFPISLVSVGDFSYGPIAVYTYYAKDEGLEIGKYCSIAKDVRFLLGGNHRTDSLMVYPIINKFIDKNTNESLTKGKIVLEDDIWIGVGATILSGVRIGQGSVVAAGSVVTKSFPPYSIIGGNPAKIIKMRFDENLISKLKETDLKLGSIDPKMMMNHIEYFENKLDGETIDKVISTLYK